ncbi:MAG TPA: metal ABC transporter substrate-binding protein, partial [Lachnospiraceae bacterium]|nr:metal ABC transporter substrate-binding protein [Lachnospiraceae bacterium]
MGNKTENEEEKSDKISIVCTIFPQYDWTRTILGDDVSNVELNLLVQDGANLHSYQPSASDIAMISNADLVIYVGGESNQWVEDAMENAVNENQLSISLIDAIGERVTEEVLVEGMEAEEEHEEQEAGEEIEYDEHVWMSIENAAIISKEIESSLEELNPQLAEEYQKNLQNYEAELQQLDEEYQTMVAQATTHTVVVGDRFPFHYLMDEYDILYYAAFPGCSADTEADFETVIFLAEKLDEYHLAYVLTVENSNQSIASTIIENTQNKDQSIAGLNSMETITNERMEAGDTYLSIMSSNLLV